MTLETLADRVGMTKSEMQRVVDKAGIIIKSTTTELTEAQRASLLTHIGIQAKATKTKKRTKLGVSKSTLTQTPAGQPGPNVTLRRGTAPIRKLDPVPQKQPTAAKPADTKINKARTTAAKTTTRTRITQGKPDRRDGARAPVIMPAPKPRQGRGPLPEITIKRPPKIEEKPTTRSPARVINKATTGKKPTITVIGKTAEKKTKRSRSSSVNRFSGVIRKKGGDNSHDLQLNEFQRQRSEGRSTERTEPLKSTLLNQNFTLPTHKTSAEIIMGDQIQVGELAHQIGIKSGVLIKELMKLQVMATVNQRIDFDVAEIIADQFGHRVTRKEDISLERLAVGTDSSKDQPQQPRPPVITVMGHVDHGKTSLLDYIRRTKVTEGEAGGITQHIGAYHVTGKTGGITFLDTPGHAAFTAMRARGAQVTDIVILVVAADDKVMPQTIEAIQHARAAKVPIIVALSKIDKPDANPDKLINQLAEHNLVPEDWGGDTQFVQVSAHTGDGIDQLLEAVLLQAEVLELKAPITGTIRGAVIESWLDKNRGPVATILVHSGTLSNGTFVLAGTTYGRVRAMFDEQGKKVASAGPSMPVTILGLDETPQSGDELIEVVNERAAKELVEARQQQITVDSRPVRRVSGTAADPFATEQAAKVLGLVIKADTQGSIGAITHALSDLENDQLELNLILTGVGGITESDVSIAHATGARVIGFNVRADKKATGYCEKEQVNLKYYSIIYELIEEVDNALHGLLEPIIEEQILGIAEVREVFSVSRFGKIAGCLITQGTVQRNKPIRVLRDDVVVFEGELESLKRFKEDQREVRSGMECGIGVKNYKDVKAGDKIEVFDRIEKQPSRRARG